MSHSYESRRLIHRFCYSLQGNVGESVTGSCLASDWDSQPSNCLTPSVPTAIPVKIGCFWDSSDDADFLQDNFVKEVTSVDDCTQT